ncbi:MAG TPA: lysophospholipid acyltransferase family protein [Phycisphaerae bacterium]|nr:lysophospholipid acyltransferase family protein [Phycisphaerae bacterium]HRY70281.1 lysophospholipid acyltransferase family protein [Phycisphaerae bacterium]HSA27548.1 lysophospholipid acyltransferase family protein [Phycisphaerae bacterium]
MPVNHGDSGAKWWVRAVLWLNDLHRRMLGVWFSILGPRVAYAVTGLLARLLYRLLTPLRQLSEAQCAAALAGLIPASAVTRVAERAFVHRVWDLTDLVLADRLLHAGTYERYGGLVPEPHLARMLALQRRGQPVILLSSYYGPFDLLPVFLGFNGIRAAAVYRRHANAAFDAYRRRIRARGGCELVEVERGADRLAAALQAGGSIALVADHYADRRGMEATFLGLPTRVMRSVGLFAWRYEADVVVAGIRRLGTFQFEIIVEDVIDHTDWRDEEDSVAYITNRYLRGLERIIVRDPTQYLWAHTRWGHEAALRALRASGPVPGAAAGNAGK